ncbi:MAG: hypothetical protein ACHQHP_02110 [Bacteroidia bacterium]
MLRSILYLLKLSLYWLIFFTLYRVCFLLIYPGRIPHDKLSEAMLVFFYSIRLDASTIAYLIGVPFILWAIQQFIKNNILNRINHFYNLVLISATTVLCISNIAMYGEWNALINYNTLFYLAAPAKMFPYLTTLELVGVFIGVAVVISIFVLLFRFMILMVIPHSTSKMIYKMIFVPVTFPILFFFMRGGTQDAPINETFSCYSETKFFNHVSVNPVWHLGHMVLLAIEEPKKASENNLDDFFKWK